MDEKSRNDLEAALANIARNLRAYYAGDIHAYRPVAVILRTLLCADRNGLDNSLALRAYPNFSLHPLRRTLPPAGPGSISIPGPIYLDGRPAGFVGRLFDDQTRPIPLKEWRNQTLITEQITIRELIRTVADKEAAHSDPGIDSKLQTLKAIRIGGLAAAGEYIAAVAEYTLQQLLIHRLREVHTDVLACFTEQRALHGPGAMRMVVEGAAQRACSWGVPLDYLTAAAVREMDAVAEKTQAADAMDAFSNSSHFLLWVEHLKGPKTLYSVPPP